MRSACVAVPTCMRINRHEAGISRHAAHNCMRRRTSMQGQVCRCSSCMQDVQVQSCMPGRQDRLFFRKGGVSGTGAAGGADAGVRTRTCHHVGRTRASRRIVVPNL
jgi:hypothetical protein